MTYPHHIERFITGYLSSQGALCDKPSYGIVEVLAENKSDWAGSEHLILGFDYEAAQEYPGAQFISYGSSVYGKVVEAALNKHSCTLRYVPPATEPPGELAKKLAFKLSLAAGHIEIVRTKLYLARCMRFQFKISYLGEQREERIASIWLDGQSGNQIAYEDLPHIFFDSTRQRLLPELSLEPLSKLFSSALEALAPQIQARKKDLELASNSFLKQDTATTESYFGSLIEDAQLRITKARLSNDQKTLADAQGKLENIEHQRRHHLADVDARHRVGHETTLLSVTCYVVPRWCVTYRDKRSQASTEPRIIWWDQLLKNFL